MIDDVVDAVPSAQTADRALLVLDAVASIGPCRMADLVKHTGFERRILGRLVASLIASGLVERVGSNGRYELGSRLVELGRLAEERNDFLARARPVLEGLMARASATTILHRVHERDMAPILILTPADVLAVSYPRDRRIGLHEGTGRAALAWLPDARIAALTTSLGAPVQALCREGIVQVRETGVATSFGEVVKGVYAIGAAVRTLEGRPLAVLAVVAPEGQHPERFTKELVEAAEALRKLLPV